MTTLDEIKSFLSDVTDVSLGYNEINFIKPYDLDEAQIGYSRDPNGNSFVTGREGDWQGQWLVIASDHLGDPLFLDVSSPDLIVLSAAHGEGSWEPFIIADSLSNFKNIISILHKISKKRTNPVEIQKNPITVKEKQDALEQIEQQNPDTEIWFWETYFEDD